MDSPLDANHYGCIKIIIPSARGMPFFVAIQALDDFAPSYEISCNKFMIKNI